MLRTDRLALLAATIMACVPILAHAQQPPGPGDTAPPITLDDLTNAPDGAQANWDTWSTGTTVIEFWGTWCGPCVAAIPHINELHDEFAPKGVNFLSVTFEEPTITDRFQERMKLHTWIGHDMDESMVDAYAVRGWPTTFIVRDGTIVARTHPSALTKERLATIVEGNPDPYAAKEQQNQKQPGQLGPDGRPILSGGITPGIDPYSPIEDQPAIQIIVRPAGDYSMSSFGGTAMTALGQPVRGIVTSLFGLRHYAVEVDPAVTEEKFDVIYRIPRDQYAALIPAVRELVTTGLGVRLETEMREVDAYELRIADTGLKLKDSGMDRALGMSTMSNGMSTTITSASASMTSLIGNVAGIMGAPVLDRTEHDGYLFLDLDLTADKAKLPEELLEQAGLVLVPTRHEIEFTIIKPAN
ncbi:MAG: TIGR03435 family protein [Phycisphaerales bacterium JB060]